MKNILMLFALFFSVICFAQTAEKPDNVYDVKGLDIKPEYPEGAAKLNAYLSQSLPKRRHAKSATNKVYATFIIEKDGTLSDINILGKPDPQTAGEIMTRLKSLPKWNPGQLGGKPVRVLYPLVIAAD